MSSITYQVTKAGYRITVSDKPSDLGGRLCHDLDFQQVGTSQSRPGLIQARLDISKRMCTASNTYLHALAPRAMER